MVAEYQGDDPSGYFEPSQSSCMTVVVSEIASVAIEIHDEAEAVVNSVAQGSTVHPLATVSGGGAIPTGSVTFRWYANGTCTPLAFGSFEEPLVLGEAHALGDAQNLVPGSYSVRGFYSGDGDYAPSDSPCEVLTVTE